MYLLGLDIGTSSIKASVVEVCSQQEVVSASFPDVESEIDSPQAGWAEQDPEMWWKNSQEAILKVNASGKFNPKDIVAIGISYQMHGLVMVDKDQKVLRPSIIWCDSRAVAYGEKALQTLGKEHTLGSLLNSPGNFTASKLAWVKENEPALYAACDKIMLPGDFIAMKMTRQISISNSGLSEGIFWDFKQNKVSAEILSVFGFDGNLIPDIKPVFSNHGELTPEVASPLGLKAGIPIAYKAGDQPNNALSLNVVNPGEIAATAGTSGVVYAVSDQVAYDEHSRINSFAHVNHGMDEKTRIGILLCINGTGILNRWVKDNIAGGLTYADMNNKAAQVPVGSAGLSVLPFGNGAERMLQNKVLGAQFLNLDFNAHTQAHLFRASQEGIAFSLKYGFDLMQNLGVKPNVIRAGEANMFLSDVFTETIVNTTQVPVEMYDTHGAKGAALGGGVGAGLYSDIAEAMQSLKRIRTLEPNPKLKSQYEDVFSIWKERLLAQL
jgi:xylulokinase